MDRPFQLTIISPEKTVFSGKAVSVIVPAESGYLGVLAGHAPLVANIIPGKITVKEPSGAVTAVNCEKTGFFQVLDNNATLLL